MTVPVSSTFQASAAAKLNLGLAVPGRRDNGYHDLLTIIQSIQLSDDLRIEHEQRAERPAVIAPIQIVDEARIGPADPIITSDDNLAIRALRAGADALGLVGRLSLTLTKRIPAASGLGGASSDAAAALEMLNLMGERELHAHERHKIALSLGSDVPFFLNGGTALVSGVGDLIEPLPPIGRTFILVVVPRLSTPITRKTATLYAALRPGDFSDGEDVREQARRIRAGLPVEAALLGNAFSRALDTLVPELAELRQTLRAVTESPWALSGAGPAHYSFDDDEDRAIAHLYRLRNALGSRAQVFISEPSPGRLWFDD